MDWREKSKYRQWLKPTSVFLYTPSQWREWGGNWQGASAVGEAEGWVGSQATPVHPQAVSWAASPGIRHLPGARGTSGLWGAGDCHSTLYPLSYPCQWKSHRHSPGPTWGVLPGLSVKPSLPRICSPTRLGSCHLMGNFWGVSPNTITAPLDCDAAQKCPFQCRRGDRRQLTLPFQPL